MSELLQQTAELIDIASVSYDEKSIADVVEERLRKVPILEVIRIENNVVARTHLSRSTRLVIGGHLDTVPPSGNAKSRLEGDVLHGCGSADMKGGIAIMIDLAMTLMRPSLDMTFIFYACEEVARSHSGLLTIEQIRPELLRGDAAILLEPTNALVEAGCQGVLRVEVQLRGQRAHSARPWVGINAIHRLGPLLEIVSSYVERMPVIDGCTYRETLQAVKVDGGVAGNVIPDKVIVTLSHRFAPDRSIEGALVALTEILSPAVDREIGDRVTLVDAAPAAPPSLEHELLANLVRESGQSPIAKIAWTDVAFFYERGIPAANFGPGDPLVAHGDAEFVTRGDLDHVHRSLKALIYT